MRSFAATFSILIGLSGSTFAASPADVATLVERLGSGSYRDRQQAFVALDALGEVALDALRLAAGAGDIETRVRADELIRRIEQRQMAARILAPTLVDINYNSKSIHEAIRDFSKVTGLPVTTPSDNTKPAERKVTFHSGKVPIWEAFSGFVAAANVTEWDGLTALPGLPSPFAGQSEMPMQRTVFGGNRIAFSARGYRAASPTTTSVYVYDGTPTPLPTCYAGAMRVRALPVGTPLPNMISDPNEIVVPLQVSAEAKIVWQGAPSVKIATASDERGQKLNALVIGRTPSSSYDDEDIMFNMMMINAYGSNNPALPHRSQYVAVRFRRGELPAKALTEVAGVLTLPIRVTSELAAIDNPIRASATTATAPFGTLTIHKAEREEKGAVKIEVGFELAPEAHIATNSGGARMQNNVQFQGGVMVSSMTSTGYTPTSATTEYMGLALFDAKGNKFHIGQVGNSTTTSSGEGMKVRTTITFKPTKDNDEPARLTLSGTHPASIEMPFAFKNLPVP